MDRRRAVVHLAAITACSGFAATSLAVNTVTFSPSAAGATKSVQDWGVDTAWPSYDNVRQSVQSLGAANVDSVRVTFEPTQALIANGDGTYSLNTTAKAAIDTQLSLAAIAGTKPLTFVTGATAATYSAVNYVRTIKATQEYINSKTGWTNVPIKAIEAFNEPDWAGGEGTPADLNNAITALKTYSVFQNTTFLAASTLNSDNARYWYDRVPAATAGSSHLLGGSMTSYVAFMDYVKSTGKPFINPELHSLGEAIVGAEHGMTSGTYWADALRARGLFVQASDGKRLGYSENLDRQSAAAVYRAPDGKMYAFAGGVERFGKATAYRFVSDSNVYFNGIPVREFMLQTKWDETSNPTAAGGDDFQNFGSWSSQGAYADVELDGSGVPALDGYRWKIVNAATGQVMEVAGSGTADGSLIRSATDTSGLNQEWNVVRTRNGYYELFNANSGKTAEVANGSLGNGASVRQWGTADNQFSQWTIESAGGGAFYLRNAYSFKYLTSSTNNSVQYDLLSSNPQKWKFVLAAPVAAPRSQQNFEGNAASATGVNNGTAFGTPTYAAGPTGLGQAIKMDGDDYVQLPAGAASTKDITIASWVKWDGGAAWQRIFDFGNDTTKYMFLTPSSGDGTMRFAITTTGGDGEQVLETSALPTGQWVHLALTLGGNTGILYVNGVPRVAGQILLDPTDIASTLNYLGKSQFNDPLYRGMLDDFRLYDYALDPSQIASLVPKAWSVNADGLWSVGTNWNYGSAPNGAGHSATFGGPFSGARNISLDAPASLGSLNFSSTSSVTISGGSLLTMDALLGTAQINVTAGSHVIATPLSLADATTVSVASGTSLDVTNTFDAGGSQLTKTGAGTLQVAQIRNASLNVQAGTVRIAQHTAASPVVGTSKVTSLSIAAGATLDLTNNALAIDYTGASAGLLMADVRGHLQAGRLIGDGDGPNGPLVLGYVDNIALHRTTLAGVSIDDSTLVIQLSLKGDADLSGGVDFADLVALAQNYNGTEKYWSQGDFDYNGTVDFADLVSLAQNYNQSLSVVEAGVVGADFATDFALAQSFVPEPTSLLAAIGVMIGASRRRRA